jgi:hypothetical protein
MISGIAIPKHHHFIPEDCLEILTDAFAATELLFTRGSTPPETLSTLRRMLYDRLRRYNPGYNQQGVACKYAAHIHLRAVAYGVPYHDAKNCDDIKRLVDAIMKLDMQDWKDMAYVYLWVYVICCEF